MQIPTRHIVPALGAIGLVSTLSLRNVVAYFVTAYGPTIAALATQNIYFIAICGVVAAIIATYSLQR